MCWINKHDSAVLGHLPGPRTRGSDRRTGTVDARFHPDVGELHKIPENLIQILMNVNQ